MGRRRVPPALVPLLALALLCIPMPAHAEQDSPGFSVRAELPANQVDQSVSYFDLRMATGQQQELTVTVSNTGGKDIEVGVEAASASTNANGLIDYTTPDVRDESLKVPFSDVARVETPTLRVPAGGASSARVLLTMPEKPYDGTVLGGLSFTKAKQGADDAEDAATTASGVMIENEYRYVIGAKLTESDVAVTSDFEALGATPELSGARPGVTHSIRNSQAAIAKDATLDVSVWSDKEQKVVKTAHADGVSVAPNSVLPYFVPWDGPIAPGTYTSHVTLRLGDGAWDFDMPFRVDGSSPVAAGMETGPVDWHVGIPWWAILLIVLLVLLIILAIVSIVLRVRRGKTSVAAGSGQRSGDGSGADEQGPEGGSTDGLSGSR